MWVWGTSFPGLFSWNENIVIINVIVNLLPESNVVCVVVAAVLGHGKQTHWAPSDRTHNTNVQFVSSDFKSGFRTPVADDDVDDLMCLAVVYSSANWTKVAADVLMPLLDMLATSVDAPHTMSLYCNYASNPYGSSKHHFCWLIPPLATWCPSNFGAKQTSCHV